MQTSSIPTTPSQFTTNTGPTYTGSRKYDTGEKYDGGRKYDTGEKYDGGSTYGGGSLSDNIVVGLGSKVHRPNRSNLNYKPSLKRRASDFESTSLSQLSFKEEPIPAFKKLRILGSSTAENIDFSKLVRRKTLDANKKPTVGESTKYVPRRASLCVKQKKIEESRLPESYPKVRKFFCPSPLNEYQLLQKKILLDAIALECESPELLERSLKGLPLPRTIYNTIREETPKIAEESSNSNQAAQNKPPTQNEPQMQFLNQFSQTQNQPQNDTSSLQNQIPQNTFILQTQSENTIPSQTQNQNTISPQTQTQNQTPQNTISLQTQTPQNTTPNQSQNTFFPQTQNQNETPAFNPISFNSSSLKNEGPSFSNSGFNMPTFGFSNSNSSSQLPSNVPNPQFNISNQFQNSTTPQRQANVDFGLSTPQQTPSKEPFGGIFSGSNNNNGNRRILKGKRNGGR